MTLSQIDPSKYGWLREAANSIAVERAREALRRGNVEKALLMLDEGVVEAFADEGYAHHSP